MDRGGIEAFVRRWAHEAVAEGREEVFDELLDEDVRDVSGDGETRGRESFKMRARAVAAAFAERSVVVDSLVIEGDAIAWRWTLSCTHVAKFLDFEPTGRRVTLRGVNFQRLRGERVVEHWTIADLAGLARQLASTSGSGQTPPAAATGLRERGAFACLEGAMSFADLNGLFAR